MACHIKNKKVQLRLGKTDTAFDIIMQRGRVAEKNAAYDFMRSFRQLLQKPDLSKAQLRSWLNTSERRKAPRVREEARRWDVFMREYVTSNANCNNA